MRWREFVAEFGDDAIYSWEEVVGIIYSMLSCETRQSQRPLRMRFLTHVALTLFVLIAASLPGNAQTQGAVAAFQENYADVNGVRLHYASVGSGPLILFLHGYPSFWYSWKDQMAEMGRDHLAVGLDMRGYNLSSKPEGREPYEMKHLVEDVRQFAEKIGGKDK